MIVWSGTSDYATGLRTGGVYDLATNTWTATNLVNAPEARMETSAVWTGSTAIFWGGWDGAAALSSGGIYDPVADTWVTPASLSLPSIRDTHTAVWTGSKMIVWGGSEAGKMLNSGGIYDPSTHTWTQTTLTGAPQGRDAHSAVWTGTKMIVWGGKYATTELKTGGIYDPAADSWTATLANGTAPSARYNHVAVWTGSKMIVWGGFTSGGTHYNTGGLYDPGTNSWTATSTGANVPDPRDLPSVVWTGSKMIVWGGCVAGWTNTGGVYDPVANSWTATSTGVNVPAARQNHTAVWTGAPDNKMIVWGGDSSGTFLRSGGVYDLATNSWTTTSEGANVPAYRYQHTAVWTGSKMIIWGGSGDGTNRYNTGGVYNLATDSWTSTSTGANVPQGTTLGTAVWTGSKMIVFGGNNSSGKETNTGGTYDVATNTWENPFPLIQNRSAHSAVWTGTKMIVWGGSDGVSIFGTGDSYDPALDTWTTISTASAPSERREHLAFWTGAPDNKMIVWGGFGASYSTTGGIYDPALDSWTATSTTNVPAGRRYFAGVWTGSKMIVWGGKNSGGTRLNSGGVYNLAGNSWTATSTGANVPVARFKHSAVWTGSKMIIWGGGSAIEENTGGIYDPVTDTWKVTSLVNAPSARDGHWAEWIGTTMLVWGGYTDSGLTNTGGMYAP